MRKYIVHLYQGGNLIKQEVVWARDMSDAYNKAHAMYDREYSFFSIDSAAE